ncbi:src kinase-associated phosphoprotein 2 isoform X3 [Heterodontus francisci]|uniref:src kinase-associated phosphoprotein 2 isoform X3 n=1 Tax=Heterodontus francisci TaxID=7792 RepID=UPI00355C229F
MQQIPEDVKSLITDIEIFILEILKEENLTKKAKEKKDVLLRKLKVIKTSYPQEFQEKAGSDDSDSCEEPLGDGASLASERCDNHEEAAADVQRSPAIAAQELNQILKAGYLEKRRKDHSFFGSEWQKRWCVLNNNVFYYYGTEKDKQQKGDFAIDGYTVQLTTTIRKDAKKDCCFELCAPYKRLYQVLGIWFGGAGACAKTLKERVTMVHHKLNMREQRSLSIAGKNLVRCEALTLLLYVAQIWPIPNSYNVAVTRAIFRFIWRSEMDRIKRDMMFKPLDQGGKMYQHRPHPDGHLGGRLH